MANDPINFPNQDLTNSGSFPKGRFRDNDGSNNGSPINRLTHDDFLQFFVFLMRYAGIDYSDTPDNITTNQYAQALRSIATKNDTVLTFTSGSPNTINVRWATVETGEYLFMSGVASAGALRGSNNVSVTLSGEFVNTSAIYVVRKTSPTAAHCFPLVQGNNFEELASDADIYPNSSKYRKAVLSIASNGNATIGGSGFSVGSATSQSKINPTRTLTQYTITHGGFSDPYAVFYSVQNSDVRDFIVNVSNITSTTFDVFITEFGANSLNNCNIAFELSDQTT